VLTIIPVAKNNDVEQNQEDLGDDIDDRECKSNGMGSWGIQPPKNLALHA
jgi:hypothetical protein